LKAMSEHKRYILEIRNLSFSHGKKRVLSNISLKIPYGVFYGIIGPNGCGKTTLLDLIAGIKRPSKGSILYKNKEVWKYPRKALAREISYVPQEYAINFSFTVEEVVTMGRHPYMGIFSTTSKADLKIIKDVMNGLKLSDLGGRLITQLSGGEKQRVVFARALAQDTPLILLDEATSNMDISFTLLCLGRIRQEVEKKGLTAVASFHDLNLAGAYCDRIAFIKDGQVVAEGSTDQVLCLQWRFF